MLELINNNVRNSNTHKHCKMQHYGRKCTTISTAKHSPYPPENRAEKPSNADVFINVPSYGKYTW